MNESLQDLEIKVENEGATPQGKLSADEWNIVVEALKKIDNNSALWATQSWVEEQQYLTEITSGMIESVLGYQPYDGDTNRLGFLTSSALNGYATQSWVNTALSVYFLTSNFTKANIKNTLGISDWALASSLEWGAINSKPTDINGYGMVEYLTNLNNATLDKFFRSSFQASNRPAYNYAVGFTLGNGSISANYAAQLAIDYYGGVHTRYKASTEWSEWVELAPLSSVPTKLSQLTDDVVAGKYLLVGGTAASATKLATSRTIWGKNFDGTGDVSGDLSLYPQTQVLNASSGVLRFHSDSTLLSGPSIQGVHAQQGYGAKNLVFYQHNTGGYTEYEAMRLTYDGNLVIGGTTADEKLHVHGNVKATGTFTTTDYIRTSKYIETGYLHLTSGIDGSFRTSVFGDAAGWGRMKALRTGGYETGSYGVLPGNYTTAMAFAMSDTHAFIAIPSAASKASEVVVGGGNADKLNWSATLLHSLNYSDYALPITGGTIKGNLLTEGGITMYSQRSLKNILSYDGLSLEQLSVIKPIKFTWKDGRDNRYHVGGVADDVATVVPEVVYSADDFLTMDYGNAGFYVAASLIKPVLDHETRIEQLECRVKELEQENKQLRQSA